MKAHWGETVAPSSRRRCWCSPVCGARIWRRLLPRLTLQPLSWISWLPSTSRVRIGRVLTLQSAGLLVSVVLIIHDAWSEGKVSLRWLPIFVCSSNVWRMAGGLTENKLFSRLFRGVDNTWICSPNMGLIFRWDESLLKNWARLSNYICIHT